jgi:phage gp46-like protein
MAICASPSQSRPRRTFWTTQPGACGQAADCGADCGRSGLSVVEAGPAEGEGLPPRTILTNDWVRSLALNILQTDGRAPDSACGYRPGGQGGHWSESFRKDGQKVGTLLRTLPSSSSIRDNINLVRATLVSELNRLVVMGIAKTITVDAEYLGGNRMSADISIIAPDGTTARVGMTGARNSNAWAWS